MTRVDHVEQAILDLVAERGLRPGDRLPAERELVARTAASRAAVREAIGRLCRDRLLVSRRGSGTYVAPVDVAAITAVRALLEPEAAAGAARERSEAQARRLERRLDELRASLADAPAFAAADAAIHAEIAAACGNPVLRDTLARLERNAAASRARTSPVAALRRQALADMEALVAAVVDQRPAEARHAMERHLARLRIEGDAGRI